MSWTALLRRLENFGGYEEGDIYLYESGMSAIFAIHRLVSKLDPGKKTLQLDFPYVDSLKVQNNCTGEFSAVFCEIPSNPLLRTIDLQRISNACREGNIPLVVDDTVASCYNVDVKPYADIVTTSMTKWISGKGDVMAGAAQLVAHSPFYNDLKHFFEEESARGNRLYAADAAVLDSNSQGFIERIQPINENAEAIVEFLKNHDAIDQIWYPSLILTSYSLHSYRTLRRA